MPKTKAQLQKEIETLRKKLGMKKENKQVQLTPTGKFSLEIRDTKAKETIYTMRGLSADELHWWRRDLYKIFVRGMKKQISMKKTAEFKKVGAK